MTPEVGGGTCSTNTESVLLLPMARVQRLQLWLGEVHLADASQGGIYTEIHPGIFIANAGSGDEEYKAGKV